MNMALLKLALSGFVPQKTEFFKPFAPLQTWSCKN